MTPAQIAMDAGLLCEVAGLIAAVAYVRCGKPLSNLPEQWNVEQVNGSGGIGMKVTLLCRAIFVAISSFKKSTLIL